MRNLARKTLYLIGEMKKEKIKTIINSEIVGDIFILATEEGGIYVGTFNQMALWSQFEPTTPKVGDEVVIWDDGVIFHPELHKKNKITVNLNGRRESRTLPAGWQIEKKHVAQTGSEYYAIAYPSRSWVGSKKIRVSNHMAVYDCDYSFSPLEGE